MLAWDGHNGNEELDKSICLPLKRVVWDNSCAMQWLQVCFKYPLVLPVNGETFKPSALEFRPE